MGSTAAAVISANGLMTPAKMTGVPLRRRWMELVLSAAVLLPQATPAQVPRAAAGVAPHPATESDHARELAASRAQLESLHREQQNACSPVKRPDCDAKTKALAEKKPALEKRITELSASAPPTIQVTPTGPAKSSPIVLPTASETKDPITAPVGHRCFIATAAFGSPMAPEVLELRRFRDEKLAGSALGDRFIETYYALSPPIADAIATRPLVRAWIRVALRIFIAAVHHPMTAVALVLGTAFGWRVLHWSVRRRVSVPIGAVRPRAL